MSFIRDPLPNTLMRSGLVEIADIFPGDVFEVLLVEEERAIEGLATQAAYKSFTSGIMFGALENRSGFVFRAQEHAGSSGRAESYPASVSPVERVRRATGRSPRRS